ncbi:Cytochrome c biogenesis protein CcdA [Blastococcus aggregatus]|uniref:Cytochrome c biogenesis protein CcdA n=1 Tax=Blastococcus aggregatus TaxID=38502 RepID=A0A285V4G8_9ACTN|nr:cytochrome c biogenesis CcdA family protein [Blastococcus aggregatus]SOC48949.1 Cytochrome c biogenesis protein CcdA [Blastococcus aggregatus]
MGELGLAAAFLGGALTLISPCSALLLPSFFAYAFAHPRELLARTVVFWLGLCLTLVPLGVGSALVSTLFYGHREVLIAVAGWTIIALGVVQILGGGFGLPGADRLRARVATPGRARGWAGTFALGAVYGLAGFCSGPILGAVLTLAATDGGVVGGGVLLAVYALGMAAPMFVLALLWDRFDLGRRRWLRGRPLRIGGRQLHTTQLISGGLFVVVGWLFLRFDGTAGITGVLGFGDTADLEFEAQSWITEMSARHLDVWVLAAAAALLLGVIARRLHRLRTQAPAARPDDDIIDALDRQEPR